MNRRKFLRDTGLVAGALLSTPLSCKMFENQIRRPNILFLFADDLCWEALSILGSEVQTPNLDRLAKMGVTFTNAYNQGAWHGAVCVASRTMLVTGLFLGHAKKIEPTLNAEMESGRLWPQYLSNAGYDTYMSGKWHIKTDATKVFDTVKNIRPGMPGAIKEGYNRPVEGEPEIWFPWDKQLGGYWKGGKHWTEVLGDDAIEFIDIAKKRDNPFFMYLAFNAPHDPRQSPKEYVDMYNPDDIKIPENFMEEYPYDSEIGCGEGLRDERLAPFPRTEYSVQIHRQEYYAIISHMDSQIGRILDTLEKSGMVENTYIFFTADHGLAVGKHGLLAKQNMFEHSMKAPVIIQGPNIPENRRIETPIYLQDIMPTVLELAGVVVPENIQFKSLLPVIFEERFSNYDAIYGGYMNLQRMVRKDNFKLIYYTKINKTLLFDLEKDPNEMNDLSDDQSYASKIMELKQFMKNLQKEVGDSLILDFH